MTEAEEHHVNLVERHLVGEFHLRFANQPLVHVVHFVAGIALRIGKHNLNLAMLQQHSNQFAARIACGAKYSNFNHILYSKK